MKHCSAFTLTKYFSEVFILCGKMLVVLFNYFAIYMYLRYITGDEEEISAMAGGPMIIIFLITYFLVSIFLNMFNDIVASMMTCHAIDLDMNGGFP